MPFDYKGFKFAVSGKLTSSKMRGGTAPDGSVLVSNRWDTDMRNSLNCSLVRLCPERPLDAGNHLTRKST